MFFDLTATGENYKTDTFYFNNVALSQVNFIGATMAPFLVTAKQSQIVNSSFSYVGQQAYTQGYKALAPLFSFNLRKPYTDSFGSLVTETVEFINVT